MRWWGRATAEGNIVRIGGMAWLPGSAQGPLPASHAPPTPTDGFPFALRR
jgi:hypothetical protein